MISSDRIILKDNPNEINIINDIISQNFACGPSMISIIDEFGNLFLYNEYQKLYKLKIERSISHVKFLDHNFYAISKKKEFLYEFVQLQYGKFFKFENYVANLYSIDSKFSNKFEILETSLSINLLLFTSGSIH